MAKKNDDFFKKKKSWSEVKDELLSCYFKPYLQKIILTHRPTLYVDCFSGKGKFDDGKKGSPLIALDIINDCQTRSTVKNSIVFPYFIELNHANELRENLREHPNAKVIEGKYEDNIEKILDKKQDWNIFLYVDPYGIKALQSKFFDHFSESNFNTIELLINMNTFGFVREACHSLGSSYNDVDVFDDLVEYESTKFTASRKSVQDLNEIAGGDYWQKIVADYNKKLYNGYVAEEKFAKQYCDRLMEKYNYVLNMPLRIKRGQRPRYRMIHATNHEEGCLLMANNICSRWQALQEIAENQQMMFWNVNFDHEQINEQKIEKRVVEHISAICNQEKSLNKFLTSFFMEYGCICSTADVRKVLSSLEESNKLHVKRVPEFTSSGRKSTFFTQNKYQSVHIRCV